MKTTDRYKLTKSIIIGFDYLPFDAKIGLRARTMIESLSYFRLDLRIEVLKGLKITVRKEDGTFIFEHDTTKTYRTNTELAEKIKPLLEG